MSSNGDITFYDMPLLDATMEQMDVFLDDLHDLYDVDVRVDPSFINLPALLEDAELQERETAPGPLQ